jgi:hypothetical protein
MPRSKHKYHFIYKTTNLKNGKYYIGMHSTYNLNDGYIGSGKKLWHSIEYYGKDSFKFEILEFFDCRENLIRREKELVNEDALKDPMCMNLQPGGGGGLSSEEHAKNFHLAGGSKSGFLHGFKNGKKASSIHIKKLEEDINYRKEFLKRFDWTNKRHKSETIIKMKEKAKDRGLGGNNSQFGTKWITNEIENKKIKKESPIPNGWRSGRKLNKN